MITYDEQNDDDDSFAEVQCSLILFIDVKAVLRLHE